MKNKIEWEFLFRSEDKITETWRAKIFGGWLVKDFNCIYIDNGYKTAQYPGGAGSTNLVRHYSTCVGLTFVSDPKHEWRLE